MKTVYDNIMTAKYHPQVPVTEIIINKGHGVGRSVPVFAVEDYIVFYFCIKELEPILCVNRVENTFGGWSLGGKIRKKEAAEVELESDGTSIARFSFEPTAWKLVFGEFNSLLFSQLMSGRYTTALELDISNFYDSVRLALLERWIREEADRSKGWIITLLFYLLNGWNRRNTGLHPQAVGLPQDALSDCSRILANYYLQKYDAFAHDLCGKYGCSYFRYADDQFILIPRRVSTDEIVLLLTRKLERYGLRVNQKKVKKWRTADILQYRCQHIFSIFSSAGDNQDPLLVRQYVDEILLLGRKEFDCVWNSGRPLLNRLISANIESLPNRKLARIMKLFMDQNYLLSSDCKKLARLHALNQMLAKPIDFEALLLKLGSTCCHNAFHYEVIAFARDQKLKHLAFEFRRILKKLNSQMEKNELFDY